MTTQNRKAASTRLEPGQHSIDRNTPTERVRKGKKRVVLDWSVRLHDGLLIPNKRTEGTSKTEVRNRARQQAEMLLTAGGRISRWKPTDKVEKYIDKIAIAEVESADLRPASVRRYRDLVALLREQLAGRSISATMHYDILIDALDAIGYDHGRGAARTAKTVLGRYITQPMMRHRLVSFNPLENHKLELHKYPAKTDRPKRGGQGLTAEEQERVIKYLLNLDPAEGVTPPKRGQWTIEHRINRNKNIINLTLFQAGTALRISEALQVTPGDIVVDADGLMQVNVAEGTSKTRTARLTPVLIEQIQDYIQNLVDAAASDEQYLFGSPADPMKQWLATGSTGAGIYAAQLYRQMAEELDIPKLQYLRTHLWRTTMSSRCEEAGIPREVYAPLWGHDPSTNKQHYTEGIDMGDLLKVFRKTHPS